MIDFEKTTDDFAGLAARAAASVFDAFSPAANPALRRYYEQFCEVVALPGQLLNEEPQPGDVLLRRGETGLAHAAFVAAPGLWRHEQLTSQRLRPEGSRPGLYAHVVEGGAFPHSIDDGFARLVADPSGRLPLNQLVLRPRRSVVDSTVEAMPAPAPAQRDEVRDRPNFIVVDEKGEPLDKGEYAFHQGALSEHGTFTPDRKGHAYFGKIDPARPFVFEVRDRVCAIRFGAFIDPNDSAIEYGGTWFDWALVRDDMNPDANFWPHYQREMDLSIPKQQSSGLASKEKCPTVTTGLRVEHFLQHEHITRRPIQIAKPYLRELSKVRICATPARVRVGPFVRYTDYERAVIWLETFSPALVHVRYKKAGSGGAESSSYYSTVRVGGRHFAAVELVGLEQDKFYDYTVELAPLPATGDIPVGPADIKAAFPTLTPAVAASMKSQFAQTSLDGTEWPTFRTLRKVYDSRLRFAIGSCRWYPGDVGKDDKKEDEGVCATDTRTPTLHPKKLQVKDKDWGPDMLNGLGEWLLEHAKDREWWPHFLFFSGDQIYSDEMGVDHGKMFAVGRFASRVPGPADPAASLRDKLIDGAWAGRFAHRYKSYKQPDPKVVERVADGLRGIDAIYHCYESIRVAAKTDPLTDRRQVLKRQLDTVETKWQLSKTVSVPDDVQQAREALKSLDHLERFERASEPFRAHMLHWLAGSGETVRRNPMSSRFLSHNFLLWSLPNFEQHLPTVSNRQNTPVALGTDGRGHPPAEGGRHAADFAEYAYLYERAWTSSHCVRVLLAQIPTFLIFDDHEVTDDWNFDVSWVRMLHNKKDDFLMWPKTLTDALAAYWVYQGWGNNAPSKWKSDDPRVKALDDAQRRGVDALPELRRCIHHACFADVPRDGTDVVFQTGLTLDWHYKLPFDPPFIVPDCRSRKKLFASDEDLRIIDHDSKSAPKSQTIDDKQLDWMSNILLGWRGGPVAFIVTSTPLLMQKKLMKFMLMPEIAALPWAQGIDLASLGGALFDSPKLGRGSDALLKVFRRQKDLEHMIRDRSWRDLWGLAGKMNQQGSPVKSLVFISGDVHHSYNMTANLPGKGRPTPELIQITSSGLQTTIRGDTQTSIAEELSSFPFKLGGYQLVPGFMLKNDLDTPDVALFENGVALVDVGIGREVNVVATHVNLPQKRRNEFAAVEKSIDRYVFKYTSGPEYMERGVPAVLARYLKKTEREFPRIGSHELSAASEADYAPNAFAGHAPSFVEQADAVSPVAVYDAFARGGNPALRRQYEPAYEVLAAPGALLSEQLRAGDLLVRRGEGGLGHVAVIAAPGLWRSEQIQSAGLRPEGARAGLYAQVVEGGAFPHNDDDRFARLVADTGGRVPYNQLVLRPRQSLLSQNSIQSEAWTETEPDAPVLPPFTPNPKPPSWLTLVPHWHVRRTCSGGQSFTNAGSVTTMTPSVMNPGFLKPDGSLDADPVLQPKLTKLLKSKPEYAVMLQHNIRVALVDLTGDNLCKPRYAGYNSLAPIYSASSIKYAVMYAAFQLIFDLNEIARANNIRKADKLKEATDKVWSKLKCKPDLDWLVQFDESMSSEQVSPSDDVNGSLKRSLERMISAPGMDMDASELILRIGFEYIASVMWSSGLYHPNREGTWVWNTFQAAPEPPAPNPACHVGTKPTFWARTPQGHANTLTALSVVTFFTLLAQRRLMNVSYSEGMERLLKHGCFLASTPPGVDIRATKCGLLPKYARHHVALMQETDSSRPVKRRYAFAILTTDPQFNQPPKRDPDEWPHINDFIADLDQLIKDINP